jgi:hypothetical protein
MLRDIVLRLRSLFRRGAVERELDQELRFHLEREIARNVAGGMSESEATRRAKLALGGFEQIKEETRDARGVRFFETAFGDLRYAFRTLRNSPGFTAVAVISLALGVGANTAIFQLVNAVRLRTLPVKNPQELVEIHIADMSGARGGVQRKDAVTYPIWEQIRKRQEGFSGVFAWTNASFNLSPKGEVRSVPGLWVSGEFFEVLGIRPVIGRLFSAEDDYRGCGLPGAVISYSFWQSEFGGSSSAIGKTLIINGQSVSVMGVTQPEFFGLDVGHEYQIALPTCSIVPLWFNALDAGTFWWLSVMGRLKPGTTLEQASAQLGSLSPGIFLSTLPADYPPVSIEDYRRMKLTAHSAATGLSGLRDRFSDLLWMLEAFAKQVAHADNPVGLTFRMEATPYAPETVYEIVGTVGNAKYADIRDAMLPLFYLPFSQDPAPQLTDQLLIRSNLPLQSLLPLLQRAILETDSEARFEVYEFRDLIQGSLARERLMAALSTVFAGLAALLSAVGLYGVITYRDATERRDRHPHCPGC